MHIRLFIKPYCPWCHKAQHWLDERGIKYETLDVISDSEVLHVFTMKNGLIAAMDLGDEADSIAGPSAAFAHRS